MRNKIERKNERQFSRGEKGMKVRKNKERELEENDTELEERKRERMRE